MTFPLQSTSQPGSMLRVAFCNMLSFIEEGSVGLTIINGF
jgi:hypothetical protein